MNTEASSERRTAGHDHRVNLYDLWPCELTTGPQRQHPKMFTGHETESRKNEGLSGEFWYLHVKNGSRGQRRRFAVSAVLITNSQCLLRVHSLQLIAVHQHCQHKPPLYPPPTLLCYTSDPIFTKCYKPSDTSRTTIVWDFSLCTHRTIDLWLSTTNMDVDEVFTSLSFKSLSLEAWTPMTLQDICKDTEQSPKPVNQTRPWYD